MTIGLVFSVKPWHWSWHSGKTVERKILADEERRDRNRLRAKRWRDENPGRAKEYSKRYRERNKEKERERLKRWYELNPDRASGWSTWRGLNTEKQKESERKYKAGNKAKLKEKHRIWCSKNKQKLRDLQNNSPSYLARLLRIARSDMPDELLQAKRAQLKALRTARELSVALIKRGSKNERAT